MINRTTFFAYARNAPFGGRLSTGQVQGMEAILNKWESTTSLTDIRWLAYMLATVFHETAQTMQPVRETLLSTDKAAVNALERAWKRGKLRGVKTPYWRFDAEGKTWLGRGLVQITHRRNYEIMQALLGVPFVRDPSLAMQMDNAVNILFEGMTKGVSNKGDFTKYSLEDYFNETTNDPVGARRIINGTDKNNLIASYYEHFLSAIKKAEQASSAGQLPADVTKEAATPDDKPVVSSGAVITTLGTLIGSGVVGQAGEVIEKGSNALSVIENPYQLASLVLVMVGIGVLIWLFASGRLVLFRKPEVVK